MNSQQAATIKSAMSKAGTSVKTIVFGNMILNLLMSSSLNMLWGMINTLQLIVLVYLFNINYSFNLMTMFQMIFQISSFAIIPTD